MYQLYLFCTHILTDTHTHTHTHKETWSKVFLDELVVPQLVNQFPHILKPGSLWLFHKDRRLSLSCAK